MSIPYVQINVLKAILSKKICVTQIVWKTVLLATHLTLVKLVCLITQKILKENVFSAHTNALSAVKIINVQNAMPITLYFLINNANPIVCQTVLLAKNL